MKKDAKQGVPAVWALILAATAGLALLPGQDFLGVQIPVADPICTHFLRGDKHQATGDIAGAEGAASPGALRLGAMTVKVTELLGSGASADSTPGGSRT